MAPRTTITITISGGEGFEREALTSEFVALLNSLHVLVAVSKTLHVLSEDEHQDRLYHLSRNVTVHLKEQP